MLCRRCPMRGAEQTAGPNVKPWRWGRETWSKLCAIHCWLSGPRRLCSPSVRERRRCPCRSAVCNRPSTAWIQCRRRNSFGEAATIAGTGTAGAGRAGTGADTPGGAVLAGAVRAVGAAGIIPAGEANTASDPGREGSDIGEASADRAGGASADLSEGRGRAAARPERVAAAARAEAPRRQAVQQARAVLEEERAPVRLAELADLAAVPDAKSHVGRSSVR